MRTAPINLRSSGAEDTRALAARIATFVERGDIILLAGDLGAGKTVWVQGFARGMGVDEQVTSPTFTLVRPYQGTRLRLLHADLYRLDRLRDVVDLGLVEQLDEDAVACIEWGDLAEGAVPADYLEVRLDRGAGDDDRSLSLQCVGARWAGRAELMVEALAGWKA